MREVAAHGGWQWWGVVVIPDLEEQVTGGDSSFQRRYGKATYRSWSQPAVTHRARAVGAEAPADFPPLTLQPPAGDPYWSSPAGTRRVRELGMHTVGMVMVDLGSEQKTPTSMLTLLPCAGLLLFPNTPSSLSSLAQTLSPWRKPALTSGSNVMAPDPYDHISAASTTVCDELAACLLLCLMSLDGDWWICLTH